jgi:hypothetical protein
VIGQSLSLRANARDLRKISPFGRNDNTLLTVPSDFPGNMFCVFARVISLPMLYCKNQQTFSNVFGQPLPRHHRQSFHVESVGKQVDGLNHRWFVTVPRETGEVACQRCGVA